MLKINKSNFESLMFKPLIHEVHEEHEEHKENKEK
jgi:hypothetical protein